MPPQHRDPAEGKLEATVTRGKTAATQPEEETAQECRTEFLGEDTSLRTVRAVSVPSWLPD